jgi:lipopolysaccharide transport system ATP-binding protein
MNAAISVENLAKSYTIRHQRPQRYSALRDVLMDQARSFGRKLLLTRSRADSSAMIKEQFWALRDITFDVKEGERLGIVGRNGAGKSTLLKILSRITEPTTGRIVTRGRMASLLEVGTGFHPELTGRENIFLNGAILGMTRAEIRRKFDAIVEFAEIERFLDTPVKHYSSGMYVRLAFSVAAHLEPEVLLVDEVLAVGDAQFQRKCLGRMEEVGRSGRTIVFVSHNMATISSLCTRAIFLDKGKLAFAGAVSEAVQRYYASGGGALGGVAYSTRGVRIGDEYVQLCAAHVEGESNATTGEVLIQESVNIVISLEVKIEGGPYIPNLHFSTPDGGYAFMSLDNSRRIKKVGKYRLSCKIPGNFLNEGMYFVGIAVSSFEKGVTVHLFEESALSFNVVDPIDGVSSRAGWAGPIRGVVRPALEWNVDHLA